MRSLAFVVSSMLCVASAAACGSDQRANERPSRTSGAGPTKRSTQRGPAKLAASSAHPTTATPAPQDTTAPASPSAPAQPPIDLGNERLVVAGMALATPPGFAMYACDDPCVFVMRANSVVGGILPNLKLEVFLDMPGTLAELRTNGARTYSANGTIQVQQSDARIGDDPAFDLAYDVRSTGFRQISRHAKKGTTFYVLTISGPATLPDAPIWASLRAIMDAARIVGPLPTAADLRQLQRTAEQRARDAQSTERVRVSPPRGVTGPGERPRTPGPATPAPAPPRTPPSTSGAPARSG